MGLLPMSHEPNFIEEHAPLSVPRFLRHRRLLFRWGFGLGIVFLVWGILVVGAGVHVSAAMLDGRDLMRQARDAAIQLDFIRARNLLDAADAKLAFAERRLSLVKTAQFMPWIGTQIAAADAGLRVGRDVFVTVRHLTDVGDELVRLSGLSSGDIAALSSGIDSPVTFNDLSSDTKRTLLLRLSAAAPDLERASSQIALARADFSASVSNDKGFGPITEALRPLDQQLGAWQESLHLFSTAARLLPSFAGLGDARNTLLLFLNNAELRPGGGFIGSYGLLTMKDADIQSLASYDVYLLDNKAEAFISTQAPEPLRLYLGAKRWMFRDANWSPDFAVSARTLLERYHAEIAAASIRTKSPLDPIMHQVIGLTPTFLADLLRIVGPITVNDQTFSADTIANKIQYQVDIGFAVRGVPVEQRKELLGLLLVALKQRVYALPAFRWMEVAVAAERALHQKQVVLYAADEAVERIITQFRWGGRLMPPPRTDDALLFVDANLASLKTDSVIQRSISYTLRQNNSHQIVARATMRYEHKGSFDWKTTRYRSYVRLYVPEGSRLVGTEGSLADDKTRNPSRRAGITDVSTDLGYAVFGTFIAVEPGETRDLVFEYILPDAISDMVKRGSYRLSVSKQIGAAPYALTLRLAFDKNLTFADPPETREQWGDGTYHLDTVLERDRMITVGF